MSAATIDDIPLEILQEIFLLACHNLYYLVISKFHNDLPFQHTLLAVSRRWMHAAASFPVLWSNIRVSDGYGNAGMTYPCPSSLVAALTTAIQHAGKALISCVINLNESGGPPSAAVLELLPFLIPSSRQWVSLCVYGDRTVPHVFLPLYRNLPLLKSLEITFDDGTEEALSHIFSEAPSLVSVDIKLGENGVGYILPWPQLQRACIRARGPPLQCLQNFTRAPQLEFLRYSDCTHGNSSLNIGLVTLSSVKEVDVESGLLFPLLALPSLEIATIKAHFLDSFKLMVSHSGCRIRALTIETFSSFPPMEDLEGHLPTLARLKMDAYDRLRYKVIPRDMMKLLTELEFLRGKFFGLEELWISLSCHGIDVWEGEDLVKIMNLLWEMVSSRRRMKRITLHLVFSTSSDSHVLDVGGLDQIDSFRKLKQVHARETPHVDLAIVYVDSSDEIHLMDVDPQLTMTLYPHRVIFH